MVEHSQSVALLMEAETVEDTEDRPMEEVENEPVEEVSDELGDEVKVKEEPKYASVVTSSMGMLSPLKEDQTVQYQIIDHKATKVSQSHYSLTEPLVKDITLQCAAHPHGLHYAELGPPSPQTTNRIILDEPKTPYATVIPQTTATASSGELFFIDLHTVCCDHSFPCI